MKKFISTYIIAFLGYICFFITFLFGGYIVLRSTELDRQMHDAGMGLFYWGATILLIYHVVHLIIIAILILYFIFEYLNRKKLKPLPKFLSNIHILFVVLGIIFSLIPIYLWIFILF